MQRFVERHPDSGLILGLVVRVFYRERFTLGSISVSQASCPSVGSFTNNLLTVSTLQTAV